MVSNPDFRDTPLLCAAMVQLAILFNNPQLAEAGMRVMGRSFGNADGPTIFALFHPHLEIAI